MSGINKLKQPFKLFQVEFETEGKSHFSPGGTLNAKVLIIPDNQIKNVLYLKELNVNILGDAVVEWFELSQQGKGDQKFKKIRETETYIKMRLNLIQKIAGQKMYVLNPNMNEFPFSFKLPQNIPCTWNQKSGRIRYCVTAMATLPGLMDPVEKMTTEFKVHGTLDLNKYPMAAQGKSVRAMTTVCCCCCERGPVGFVIKLDRQGFVAGENMEFDAELISNTCIKSVYLQFQIIEAVEYKAQGHEQTRRSKIGVFDASQIARGPDVTDHHYSLPVPALQPSGLGSCGLMTVHYNLQISMTLHNSSEHDMEAEIPILIGTIPFTEAVIASGRQATEEHVTLKGLSLTDVQNMI